MQASLTCDERLDYPIPVEHEPNSSPATSKRALSCIYVTDVLRTSYDTDSEADTSSDLYSSSSSIASSGTDTETQASDDASDPFRGVPELIENMDDLMLDLGPVLPKPTTSVKQPLPSPLEAVLDTFPPHTDTRLYLFSQPSQTVIEPRLFVWLDDKPDPVTRRPAFGQDCWRAQASEVFAWFHHAELETRRIVLACAGFHPGLLFIYLCEQLTSYRQGSCSAEAERLRGNRAALLEQWQSLWVFPYALPVQEAPKRKHRKGAHKPVRPAQQLFFVRYDLELLGDFVGLAPDTQKPDAMIEVVPLECEPRAFAMCNLPIPRFL